MRVVNEQKKSKDKRSDPFAAKEEEELLSFSVDERPVDAVEELPVDAVEEASTLRKILVRFVIEPAVACGFGVRRRIWQAMWYTSTLFNERNWTFLLKSGPRAMNIACIDANVLSQPWLPTFG